MSGWENLVGKDTAQLLDENDEEPEEEYPNDLRFDLASILRIALAFSTALTAQYWLSLDQFPLGA